MTQKNKHFFSTQTKCHFSKEMKSMLKLSIRIMYLFTIAYVVRVAENTSNGLVNMRDIKIRKVFNNNKHYTLISELKATFSNSSKEEVAEKVRLNLV